jgi:polyhydroxybutyrate depolymerase
VPTTTFNPAPFTWVQGELEQVSKGAMSVMRPVCIGVFALLLVAASILSLAAQRRLDQFARQTWTVEGVERSAIVASPSAPAPRTGSPLVLVFHGHGGTALHAASTFAIHTHWPEAVVIYAQGLPTPGRITDPKGVKAGWQHAPGEQGDRDLELVDTMLESAGARFTIDKSRIYAAGHSNGGTMTYVLWAARSDRFAAFAPSSSVFRRDLYRSAKPKPALLIAGRQDTLVPFSAQRRSLDATLRLNRAGPKGTPWVDGAVLYKSSINADVVADVHPGGHTLPTNAGALMAAFFKQH